MQGIAGSPVVVWRLLLSGMLSGCLAACSSGSSGIVPSPLPSIGASSLAGGTCAVLTGLIPVQSGSCASGAAGASSTAGASGTQYVLYWENDSPLSDIPAGVTIVEIAFGGVSGHTVTSPDGGFGSSLSSDISSLHARGVKVLLSLGGGGGTFTYDGNAEAFGSSLTEAMMQYGYDGVDFDDENGNDSQRVSDLLAIIPAAKAALNALGSGKLITYAAFGDPGTGSADDGAVLSNAQVASDISYLNVMSYAGSDAGTTEGYVTSYATYMPKNRTLLGVDFDGDQGGPPSASALSTFGSWVLSNGYGGMMVWQVSSAQKSGSGILSGIASDLKL